MKKIFTVILISIFCSGILKAQLEDGSIAPDFTITDLEGNSWNLYDLLDQGKYVVLDLSATWCGPCWSYHTSGVLEDLYEQYGPEGTDELMVFMIEADPSTNVDCLYNLPGCNSVTLGDWTEGVKYPIVNDDNMAELYNLAYYPTLYHICPSKILVELGQVSASAIYAMNETCPVAFGTNNAVILNYTSFSGEFCQTKSYSPSVLIQNLGNVNMTAATLDLQINGSVVQTLTWEGDLATYGITEIYFDEVTISENVMLEITITSVNGLSDDDPSNNFIMSEAIKSEAKSDSNIFTLEIFTDPYPAETYWEILDENGNAYYSGGNARVVGGTDASGAYTGANTLYTIPLALPADGCFEFNIYDSYGDGICCIEGDGYYLISDENGKAIVTGGQFEKHIAHPFSLEGADQININGTIVSYVGESGSYCGDLTFEPGLTIQNIGAETMNSIQIAVRSNGNLIATNELDVNIPSSGYGFVTLNPITINGTEEISFTLEKINNEQDIYDYKNIVTTNFNKNFTKSNILILELQLDSYAEEIYWQATDSNGNVLNSGGNQEVGPDGGGTGGASTTAPGAYSSGELVLDVIETPAGINECIDFLLVDSYGDGVVDGGGGYLKITDVDGNIVFERNLDAYRFTADHTLIDSQSGISSTDEFAEIEELTLFPTPAQDVLNVFFELNENTKMSINVFDMLGKKVVNISEKEYLSGNNNIKLNLDELASGIYYMNMTNGKSQKSSKFSIIK